MKLNWNFQSGWGVQSKKKNFHGGGDMNIFWKNALCGHRHELTANKNCMVYMNIPERSLSFTFLRSIAIKGN